MTVPVRPAGGEAAAAAGSVLRLQILGPLRLWRGDEELEAGPRQQAYLLALLLAREGQLISTSELVDLIWGDDAPASAVNVIHKYVGTLRRLLEPTRPVRGSGSYLRRRANGYLFVAGTGMLDLAVFRESVRAAGQAVARQQCEAALDGYVEALGLWQGTAGEGLAHGPAAMSIFAGLNGEFMTACAAAAELAISLGRPERVLPPLQLAATIAPLHEPLHASLITTLGAAGQQAQALSVYQTIRARLAEELGIDPGPALRATQQRLLNNTPAPPVRMIDGQPAGQPPAPWQRTIAPAKPPAVSLVGRTTELAVLRQATETALTGGRGLVIIEGEPGVGKTRLLEESAADADGRGALVVWGRCLEGDGTPSMWPWVQAIGTVLNALPTARQKWLATELGRLLNPDDEGAAARAMPDGGAQFRLFEQVVAAIGEASVLRPVLLVLDDLQWADVTSLQLFSHLAARLPAGATVIGALRDRAPMPGTELSRMLAAVSRVSGQRRIQLGPLNPAEVAELVYEETGQAPTPGTVRDIHARTAGNPFFVRELSLLLSTGGMLGEGEGEGESGSGSGSERGGGGEASIRAGVPSTVLDVVRDRLSGLDEGARRLLQVAALIGRDIDLRLLAAVAGLDVQVSLDRLGPVEALGLLEPAAGNPFSLRFSHDLVREAVARTTPQSRTPRLHLRVADALERADALGDHAAERVAHHLWSAGPLADPRRTVAALVRAGRRAATKLAFEAAERQLRTAVQVARAASLSELELSALSQLIAIRGMLTMYGTSAVDLLERAEHLARSLGRELDATVFLYSRWAAHAQGLERDHSRPLARRMLEQGKTSSDPLVRAYGLQTWGLQQFTEGDNEDAFRCLSEAGRILMTRDDPREQDPVWYDLKLLMIGKLAETTALHGDVDGARSLLDMLEAAGDDPFTVTVWAAHTSRTEAFIDDPVRALRAAERGIAADRQFSFVFLGTYQRLVRYWALAKTGRDPAGAAAEAERLIATNLLDPQRASVTIFIGYLCEMWLVAGALDQAAAALEQAEAYLDRYNEGFAEGLLLLLRARLLHARGKPVAEVGAAADRARTASAARGNHLFARRAEEFLAALDDPPSSGTG
ncbi:BTAD domain-containing putative transcriptional regulator [Sphaerisporangium sp. NPDC005288]|uniref:BTAD domain-containing putative transcriptional regulator n=1 Tax=Sphaerisporangium sp. NPDC005288 TaxID=3155114 RepID=UPI0033B36959